VKRTVPKEKKVKPEVGGPNKLTRKEMVERIRGFRGGLRGSLEVGLRRILRLLSRKALRKVVRNLSLEDT
jgi:hypothetical protein